MTSKKKQATTFNKLEYDMMYSKKNVYRFSLYLHKKNDADIIAELEKQPNRSGFIKGLIRAQMDAQEQ